MQSVFCLLCVEIILPKCSNSKKRAKAANIANFSYIEVPKCLNMESCTVKEISGNIYDCHLLGMEN